MITFRYHIVTIASVFLALAIGVVLGNGPLQGAADDTLARQVAADQRTQDDLETELTSLRSAGVFHDSFASTVGPRLLDGRLEGRVVSIVALPGAAETDVAGTADMVRAAGGTLGGTLRAGTALVDPGSKQLVDELGSQLLDGASDVSVPADVSGYARIGYLIARAVGTSADGGEPVDSDAKSILAGLRTAGLMSTEGELNRRSSLVLFVAGPPSGSDDEQQGANSIVTAIAQAVDGETDGVVVAGPMSAARSGGMLTALRADAAVASDVSTVDVLGQTAGHVVAALALSQQSKGSVGHYGAIDAANGSMPGAVPDE